MASRSFPARVIVLRKTKLRESDLIVTMLSEDGCQLRAVAKGALKPAGSFASRLELYSESQLVEGRGLDIVKEARLVNAHAPLRFDYERSVCAGPVAELLSHATQVNLPVDRLFPMTQAALDALESAEGLRVPLVMVAFLLKASSLLGFRPSIAVCAECGEARASGATGAGEVAFSFDAGGYLCDECASFQQSAMVPDAVLSWADALIHSTFAQVMNMEPDAATVRALIRLAQDWAAAHVVPLKSLPFTLTSGIL